MIIKNISPKNIKVGKVVDTTLIYDDFNSATIDTDMWYIIGSQYGSISTSNSELTISNTSNTQSNIIGLLSKEKYPVGTRFITRVKHVSGQHVCYVGMFENSPTTIGAHGSATRGISFYGRASSNETVGSYRDENDDGGYAFGSYIGVNTYYKVEMYRESATVIKFYVNDQLIHTTNQPFANDYYFFVGGDAYSTPNTLVVDYVNIEKP